MRKADLHPLLQQTCVPIPDRSGCFAVVPPPVPTRISVPSCNGLLVLARRELEALQERIQRNPQHANLLMHMLNRREAVDSSQIEGTHIGFDGLLIHEIETGIEGGSSASDADATLSYVRAFTSGSQAVSEQGQQALNLRLISDLHARLMVGQVNSAPGQWRDRQNYIGLRMETARYIPPPSSEVPRLLLDLQGLLQYQPEGVEVVSILLRAAIAHVQFEAIHPFLDGNGRTGRLILPLMFKSEGMPPIHLASFLKLRQQEYYDALLCVQTKLEWEPWLRLFLESVVGSCRHTLNLFNELQKIQARWHGVLTEQAKRRHATIWKVTAMLLGQPVVTVNEIASRLGVSFPAANDAVSALVKFDILRPSLEQQRRRVFHAHEVMNALYTGLDKVIEDVASMTKV
ncbi:MAG: Fic family protein [Gallionellaceae bacterium]|nr:Fic family protein [Gallionellaceae bacterium]